MPPRPGLNESRVRTENGMRRTMRRDVQDYLKKYLTESFCSVLGYNKNKFRL